jgi:16S rRNA (guanine(527)-N(7))-methyltransferase RsmG
MLDALLKAELSRMGLTLPDAHQNKLALYLHELQHWNRSVNLTSLKGAELVRRLVVEPAWIGHQLQLSGTLADIGSGNGSPGVALAVTRNLATHLIEARTKRAAFLRHVSQRLGLDQVFVHRARVEDLEAKFQSVTCITLQAVSPTPHLVKALRRIFPATTRVVWITANAKAPGSSATRSCVPDSNSEVWDFRLDQI